MAAELPPKAPGMSKEEYRKILIEQYNRLANGFSKNKW
jgi:hypothetical protein